MLRIQPIADAKAAESYYSKSDGGYYLQADDLRREWGGKGAHTLGLSGPPDYEQFKRLIHGLDPHTGEQLTAKLVEHRIPAWDVNLHCSKGVTVALERGDSRIQGAFWEAVREAMADIETLATTRVRKGGKQEDRVTGNLVWYAVEHPETRPAKEDKMPDPHRHIHVVVFNLTYDKTEGEWKAVKFRPIMDLRKYFDRRFNQRFAHKLVELGYEVEAKWKADGKGGRKYEGWDIKGIPDSVVKKFSRRSAEVEKLAADLGIEDARAKDRLGATSRLHKRKGLTLEDYRKYWLGRLTPEEDRRVEAAIKAALAGENNRPTNTADKAVAYALLHHFERQSVVDYHDLAVTAMERSMGAALPDEILPEAKKQGVLVRDGQATTKEVLAEEGRVIAFARDGRGTCRPLRSPHGESEPNLKGLSAEQQAAVRHVWESPDRVLLIRGGAGTGKTRMMRQAVDGIEKPVVVLAPSADASRKTLREEGFQDADTVARFLIDEKFQQKARDGVIWVDESGLLGIRQLAQVFDKAKELNARVILQGDRKQHGSVERGAALRMLEEFAGLPVSQLKEIRRQEHQEYKRAVAAIDDGKLLDAYDILAKLGWVKQTPAFDHNRPLVEDYLQAIEEKRADGKKNEVLIIAPTHQEGDEITGELRKRLKEKGLLGTNERVFQTLKPLGWTEAERGDPSRYAGDEVIRFVRNSGPYRAGEQVEAADLQADRCRPAHFAVYGRSETALAAGDVIRITIKGKTKDGKHRLENGSIYGVAGFTAGDDIRLANGWVIAKDFGGLAHGFVSTSHASQGKTVHRVLIAMGHESRPAMSAQQFYVSVSRAREKVTIYTDMALAVLREAIQRSDPRLSATELMAEAMPQPTMRETARKFVKRVQATYRQLREKATEFIIRGTRDREAGHER
jgi:conjugative relaxase-like TrwC/TraI family protein